MVRQWQPGLPKAAVAAGRLRSYDYHHGVLCQQLNLVVEKAERAEEPKEEKGDASAATGYVSNIREVSSWY